MLEKLLENWLDSASELSYQQVFVQMLSASGYTVLHSTRHCLLEFGKDILAIAPDGVGCAFQLKGQPGKQMTAGEFRRDIQPQLVQLMSQTPPLPGFPPGIHRSYLVSNGSFSEEVQVAVAQMNSGHYPSKLQLWSRGNLLEMALATSGRLWPSEIDDTRRLLDLYMADPEDQLPIELLEAMLSSILLLDRLGDGEGQPSTAELSRIASSAMWATSIALTNFALKLNYQAVSLGWTLCRVMLQALREKSGGRCDIEHHFELAQRAILDALAALWVEVRESDHLTMAPGLEDSVIYGWRIGSLRGLMSALYLANESEHLLADGEVEALATWLVDLDTAWDLWGEAAVASVLPAVLVFEKLRLRDRVVATLSSTAKFLIDSNQSDAPGALATPYYSAAACFLEQLSLGEESDREAFAGCSYMARVLMLSLAALDMKEICQELWPDFSKLSHRYFLPSKPWAYLTPKSRTGQEVTRIYPNTYEWSALVAEAKEAVPEPALPTWLGAMWWQACPHRADAASWLSSFRSLVPATTG